MSIENEYEQIVKAFRDISSPIPKTVKKDLHLLDKPEFFNLLVQALSDTNAQVRLLAAQHLARRGYEEAYKVLLNELQANNSGKAAHTLGELRYKLAVLPLVSILTDKLRPIWLRRYAAEALGKIGDDEAIEPLSRVYLDVTDTATDYFDLGARYSAAIALSQYGDKVLPLFLSTIKALDTNSRYYAAEALGRIGNKQAVSFLIQVLDDKSRSVRSAATEALGQIGDQQIGNALFKVMLNDEWMLIRRKAAIALGQLGDKRSLIPLIEIVKDAKQSVYMRAKAARLLGMLEDQVAVEPLIKALQFKDNLVRAEAAEALANLGDKKAIPTLEWALEKSLDNRRYNTEAKEAINKAIERLAY